MHIQDELKRVNQALREGPDNGQMEGLYVAQQALAWALEPRGYKSPYDLVMGTQANSEDCSSHPSPLPS